MLYRTSRKNLITLPNVGNVHSVSSDGSPSMSHLRSALVMMHFLCFNIDIMSGQKQDQAQSSHSKKQRKDWWKPE